VVALLRALAGLGRLLTLPLLRGIGGILSTIALPTCRALSGICLVVAAVALAADAGPITSRASTPFVPTTALAHWRSVAAPSLEATQQFVVKRMRPWIWDMMSAPLRLPTFVFFAVISLVFGFLGRHRRRVEIFVN
jgi:hypothetical protein